MIVYPFLFFLGERQEKHMREKEAKHLNYPPFFLFLIDSIALTTKQNRKAKSAHALYAQKNNWQWWVNQVKLFTPWTMEIKTKKEKRKKENGAHEEAQANEHWEHSKWLHHSTEYTNL